MVVTHGKTQKLQMILKNVFFSSQRPTISLPRINEERNELCGIRFIITGMKYNVPVGTSETEKYNFWNSNYINKTERYFNVRQWWFWISAAQDRIGVQIYRATGANPNNWVTVFNKDFRMEGWSGSDWIRAGNGTTFGGSTNQTSNNWNWKIVFWSKPQKIKQNLLVQLSKVLRSLGVMEITIGLLLLIIIL